jgi:fructoselysine-6-P-deglycase FrlB-like protein
VDYYKVVDSQPSALEHAAGVVCEQLGQLDLGPWRQGTFGYVAMGASSHAGYAVVNRLARFGRRAVNVEASRLVGLGAGADIADSYLFVSESGRSPEPIEAAGLVTAGARLALTNVPEGPLSSAVDDVIALGAGPDSYVYTIGYTATLQACGLLARALDGAADGEDWQRVPELAADTLAGCAAGAVRAASALIRASSIDVVGSGASYASAAEAALLLRESTRIAAAAHETYQYLHGSMESLTGSSGCLLFGAGREVRLARYLAGAGVPTVLVTTAEVDAEPNLLVVTLPDAAPLSRAVLEILPAQLLAGELARYRGLAIDSFRYQQDDTKLPEPAGAGAAR